ncbi:shikimate dehydrogenase family protein [Autumnicola musiva]|uniref:Shikimate dehydrogenase n=1 Tax=Autumnicola musiva TaxID=3075589 RepID=A0ABU3D3W2_9FLAO|nr:shikimate dehydrogenase [Zunongwangia sp. F117]MDT0676084.1 shikimate dehydrogenase [Zunongwangia sp. F117]
MKLYGLLGRNIDYSFSKAYFSEKFQKENIDAEYRNFDIPEIRDFPDIIQQSKDLNGMNVTIPYKQEVISYLDVLDENAEKIGAVNTIKIEKDGILKGFNTDFYGFSESLKPLLKNGHSHALILGTGGASKAVAFALKKSGIIYKYVSRSPEKNQLGYSDLSEEIFEKFKIVVNTTPVGTFPNIENSPDLPYHLFTENHLAYDLIYNPSTTKFLELAAKNGANTMNGLKMLQLQAEKAWQIWNS